MELLMKGCRLIDWDKDFYGDIYILNGKIEDFGSNLNYDCNTINCEGLAVLPSFIDMHVHFRDQDIHIKKIYILEVLQH